MTFRFFSGDSWSLNFQDDVWLPCDADGIFRQNEELNLRPPESSKIVSMIGWIILIPHVIPKNWQVSDVEWHCLQNLSSDRNMIPWPRCIRKRRSSLVCNGTFLSIDKSNQKRKAKQLDRRSRYILEWLFYNYCILLFRYGLTSASLKLPASRIQCFCGNQFETDPKKSVLQRN